MSAVPIWFSRLFPFLRWRLMIDRSTLKTDAIAGLTSAIIVLPQGVAYATLAGMPPEYGLYCAMVPAVIASLFGSSWHMASGPSNTISLVVLASLSPLALPGSSNYIGLALTLAFLVGLFQLLMGLARLGALVNFISHEVLVGFTAGAAVLIAASQIGNFFGIPIPANAQFVEAIKHFATNLPQLNPYVTAVGATTLVSAIVMKRFLPKFPYMIVAMIAGAVAALTMELVFDAAGIKKVGALPSHLPPFSLPHLTFETIRQLVPIALAVTMLALTQAVSIARSISLKSEQPIDGNQEFIGQGLSNLIGSFFSSYPSSGSFNRSGLNFEAGAKTPVAVIASAVFLAAILVVVAPLAAYLPIASMAAVLFMVAYGLVEAHHIKAIIKTSRSETVVMIVTFVGTLLLPIEFAIYAGVLLSLVLFLNRNAYPVIRSLVPNSADPARKFVASSPDRPECPQLKLVRVEGPIFFGAAAYVSGTLKDMWHAMPGQKHLLLLAKSINFIDSAGVLMLAQEGKCRRKAGGRLYLYSLREQVSDLLEKSGSMEAIGKDNVFGSKGEAIGAIYPKLDSDVCRSCTIRAFKECHVRLPDGSAR